MFIIGVTGPTGAGKSDICKALSDELCAKWIDSDIIAREVVQKGQECLAELCESFGNEILLEDGNLDRSRMAKIAFENEEKLLILNKITHKHIAERIKSLIESYRKNEQFCLLDAPLLFESGLDSVCDINICVLASWNVRKKRIMKRDGIDEKRAESRMNAQKKDSFYIEKCDFVLYNHGEIDIREFSARIRKIANKGKI